MPKWTRPCLYWHRHRNRLIVTAGKMNPSSDTPIRFVLDDALGSLLKWLRLFGFDTVSRREWGRRQQAAEKTSNRDIHVTATRSRSSSRRNREGMVFLEPQQDVMTHLRYLMGLHRITREQLKPFSRCIRCNQPTQTIEKQAIRDRIPEYIWESHEAFRECPGCGRLYWRGTHAENIEQTIQRIFQ